VSAPGAGLGAGRTSGPWLPEMPALALGVRRDTGVSAIMGTKTGQQLVLLCSELLPAAAAAAAFKCYWACV